MSIINTNPSLEDLHLALSGCRGLYVRANFITAASKLKELTLGINPTIYNSKCTIQSAA